MVDASMRSIRLTADTNALLPANTLVHGILVKNGTLSATASLKLHDAITVTGNPVVEIGANNPFTALFDEYSVIWFPYPLKFYTGVSADIAGTSAVAYVFYS
jgi:hypothetical protein